MRRARTPKCYAEGCHATAVEIGSCREHLGYRDWYASVHARLRRERGAAAEHLCDTACGKQAQHWAYDHLDRTGTHMSMRIDRYRPMCARCHKLFDHFVARGNAPGRWSLEVRDELVARYHAEMLGRLERAIERQRKWGHPIAPSLRTYFGID